jgi:protein STE50
VASINILTCPLPQTLSALTMAESSQRPLSILDYTEEDVVQFLSSLGLDQYGNQIYEHRISGDILQALDSESLKEIGISSVGQRLTVLKAVYTLKIRDGVPIEPDHYVPPCMSGNSYMWPKF